MIGLLVTAVGCLIGVVPEGPQSPEATYETLEAGVGRDAGAQVKLALWCEAHGLERERLKHLAIAVLTDPSNAMARGLLGLVEFRGKWTPPDAVARQVESDAKLSETLAEYNARRSSLKGRADDHYALALWCEAHGLKAEATAHFTTVTRLDPSREVAWKHLGCKKYQGIWMTEARFRAIQAETEAQKQADRHWKPLLEKYKNGLADDKHKYRQDHSVKALAEVNDPRAAAAIWTVFGTGTAASQRVAVGLLGQIDGAVASRGLAFLAVFGDSPEVRRVAHEILLRRDPREVVDLLISMIRRPIKYEVRPIGPPGSPGVLFVEGEQANLRVLYENPGVPFNPANSSMTPASSSSTTSKVLNQGLPRGASDSQRLAVNTQRVVLNVANANQQTETVKKKLESNVRSLITMNEAIHENNRPVLSLLKGLTNQRLGEDPEPWRKWWTDQKGYAYVTPQEPTFKPIFEYVVIVVIPPPHHSCFVAGTPVRTLTGLRPIESLQAGDRVFVQNTKTGAIQLQPIVAVYHNPPNQTYRVSIDGETVAATGIHRFWKVGKGWVMARDLKPGDVIRSLGCTSKVSSVVLDSKPQPVFNLEVAEGRSFFVGQAGLLVHDNTLVEPTPDSFDAASTLAALKK